MPLTEPEKAYIAGIIDGEGCISVQRRLKKYLTVTIQVTNTRKDLLDYLKFVFGGSIYKRNDPRARRKDSWLWSVAGQKALFAIKEIRPYLKLKNTHADLVLNIPRFKTEERDVLGRIKGSMNEEDFSNNEQLLQQIRTLNQRGKDCAPN